MRARRPMLADTDGTREIWPAFTDVMSTLALILFVIVLLSYVRSLIAAKQIDAFQHQIASSERALGSLHAQIDIEQRELADTKSKVEEQGVALAASDRELEGLRGQLQNIAVLRLGVLQKLESALAAQIDPHAEASTSAVTIGDSGDLVLSEKLLFEYNSYAIKKDARPILDTLAKALGNVLDDPDVRANIDTIIIQGHTDERGSAALNWDLSAKRATAVLDYLFQANDALARSYGSYFAAAAYSKFRPIDTGNTEDAYQRNRRIEISVVPKDDNVRRVVEEYLKTQPPPPAPPAPGAAPQP